jgi:hypothetical protein
MGPFNNSIYIIKQVKSDSYGVRRIRVYSHEEAVSLFSLLERELRKLSPLSLSFCKKKSPEAKRRFFVSLLQLFFSSFVLSRKIMEKKGNFIVFSSSSPQTS